MKPAASAIEEPVNDLQDAWAPVLEKLQGWLQQAIELLPNVVVAILLVLAFGLLARFGKSASGRVFRKIFSNPPVERLLSSIISFAIIAVGVFIALGVLQLDKTVTSLLAGAGVIGIALAFAFQDLAANLMAGVYLSVKRPLIAGELVDTNDCVGVVERIDLRDTTLRTVQGQLIFIPNKMIFETNLTNYSRLGTRRVDAVVGVSYAEDLPRVQEIVKKAIESLDLHVGDREIEVFFTGFGGSSIDLVARFWIDFKRQVEYTSAYSAAMVAIKKAFDAEDISIPFPIRTIDFGIKGGATLEEALPRALSSRQEGEEAASGGDQATDQDGDSQS